jgi:hypothetical protein
MNLAWIALAVGIVCMAGSIVPYFHQDIWINFSYSFRLTIFASQVGFLVAGIIYGWNHP